MTSAEPRSNSELAEQWESYIDLWINPPNAILQKYRLTDYIQVGISDEICDDSFPTPLLCLRPFKTITTEHSDLELRVSESKDTTAIVLALTASDPLGQSETEAVNQSRNSELRRDLDTLSGEYSKCNTMMQIAIWEGCGFLAEREPEARIRRQALAIQRSDDRGDDRSGRNKLDAFLEHTLKAERGFVVAAWLDDDKHHLHNSLSTNNALTQLHSQIVELATTYKQGAIYEFCMTTEMLMRRTVPILVPGCEADVLLTVENWNA